MRRLYASLLIRTLGLVALCGLLYVALFPHTAAACQWGDFQCPVDVGMYELLVSIAEGLWKWNRLMLYLARVIEGLQTWLISDVLATALQATIAGVQFPFWIAAGVAWVVFTLSYLLQWLVKINWVDLRTGLRNALLAVILFQIGSQAMAATEQIRITVGQGFSAIAATSINSGMSTFGGFYISRGQAAGDAIVEPHSIYDGADSCPSLALAREQPAVMFMNDYLANFLDAEAHDIHCPSGAGPADLPDGFIRRFDIRSSNDFSNETGNRPTLLLAARVGLARQAQAALPALGAVLEQVMHLVYALALASIWFGVVISLMFSLFLPTEGMLKTQIDAMLATLKTSWMSSFWVGLGLTLVGLASDSGNALAVNAISIGMFVVFSFQIRGAARTMRASVAAASASLGQAPAALGEVARGVGAAARFAGRLGTDAAIIGAATATGNGAELVEAGVQQMRRRLAFSTSGNLVAQAGQRLLLDKAMGPVERWVQNEKDERAIGRSEDEGQWYEQRLGASSLTATEKARALRRTTEIDEEIDTRRAGQVKGQLRQARELGAWEKADALQQQVDSQEIDRLERQIADARQSGDARRISQIPALQRRIDSLRGVSSAEAEAANGNIGAGIAETGRRPEPLRSGLQEVGLARTAGGKITVNGHAVTDARLDSSGHQVALSAGDHVIDVSRDDYAAAQQLPPGDSLLVPANVRAPAASAAPAVAEDDQRAALAQRIQDAQRRERALMDQRDAALAAHEFALARELGEQISGLRMQIAEDRTAMQAIERTAAMRQGEQSLTVGANEQGRLAINGRTITSIARSATRGSVGAGGRYTLAGDGLHIEMSDAEFKKIQQMAEQIQQGQAVTITGVVGDPADPAAGPRADQHAVAASGGAQLAHGPATTGAGAAVPATAAPGVGSQGMVAAPTIPPVAVPAPAPPPVMATPGPVPAASAPLPAAQPVMAAPVGASAVDAPATPLHPSMVPPSVVAASNLPATPPAPAPQQARPSVVPAPLPGAPAVPVGPAETPATPLHPSMVPPSVVAASDLAPIPAAPTGPGEGSADSERLAARGPAGSGEPAGPRDPARAGEHKPKPWNYRGRRGRGPRDTGGRT